MGKYSYLLGGYIFAAIFETAHHCFSGLRLLVRLSKRTLRFGIFFNEFFLSCRVPTFRGQKVVKHGGHHGISYLFIG